MKKIDSIDLMLLREYEIPSASQCWDAEEEQSNVDLFLEHIEENGIEESKRLLNELFQKTESGELSFVDFCYSMLEGGLPVPFVSNGFGRKIKSATVSAARRLFGLAIRQANAQGMK